MVTLCSPSYSAVQLQRAAMQFISLNLPALLEQRALELLDSEVWPALDRHYRASNPVFLQRQLCRAGPLDTKIELEYSAEPLDYDAMVAGEQLAKLGVRPRVRTSSGGRARLVSTDSQDSQDRGSLIDFEIEERGEGEEEEEVEQCPPDMESLENRGCLAALLQTNTTLQQSKSDKVSPSKVEARKKRVSQKEKKRQQQAGTGEPNAKSGGKLEAAAPSWLGWATNTPLAGSPSLVDIMNMERKSPSKETPGLEVSVTRERNTSGEKKFEVDKKKKSWKKLDLAAGVEIPTKSVTPTTPTNPWKLSVSSPQSEIINSSPMETSPISRNDESFERIMKEDEAVEERKVQVASRPLHYTQMEERAIAELEQFYNAAGCTEEIITVTRMEEPVDLPAPVWRKKTSK